MLKYGMNLTFELENKTTNLEKWWGMLVFEFYQDVKMGKACEKTV